VSNRKDFVIEQGKKHNVEIPENVAYYISHIKDEEGRSIGKKDLKAVVLRVIAFASFTKREITIKLVNEVTTIPDSRNSTSSHEEREERELGDYDWMFDPQSNLEKEAYRIYDNKFGHIPVRDLTDEQIEEQKKMYFAVLEFLKEEKLRGSPNK
jgi:hypothetical protein